MSNRRSGNTTAMAVLAVLALVAGTGFFFYKTIVVDSGMSLADVSLPGMAKAAPPPAPAAPASPTPESSAPALGAPSASASPFLAAPGAPSAPAASDTPARATPRSGAAASPVARALSEARHLTTGEAKQAAEEEARVGSLLSVLQSLRSQVELYKLQHNDSYPDFRAYPKWEQIVRPTYQDGTFADEEGAEPPEGARRMGPYFQSPPHNPLNGAVEVVTVEGGVSPGDSITPTGGGKAGFVFSVADGKLFATDATGRRVADAEGMLAQLRMATPRGREEHLRSMVQTLRSQVALYRLQHQDEIPDFGRYPAWEQMLKKTEADGSISPKGRHGAYLLSLPVNPLNGFSNVEVVARQPRLGHKVKGERIGWVVDSEVGRVWPTDADGAVILKY